MKLFVAILSVFICNLLTAQNSDIKPVFYPNPVKQKLYFALVDDSINYEIISLQGQIVLKDTWFKNESQYLDLQLLKPGSYFLKINDELFHLKKDE